MISGSLPDSSPIHIISVTIGGKIPVFLKDSEMDRPLAISFLACLSAFWKIRFFLKAPSSTETELRMLTPERISVAMVVSMRSICMLRISPPNSGMLNWMWFQVRRPGGVAI